MSASSLVDEGRTTKAASHWSAILRHSSAAGWLLVASGALADTVYHLPILLFGYQWSPVVDAIGEFGHTVIFVGIVVLIFAALRKHDH